MSDVTQILAQIEECQLGATERLFPLVYDEMRKMAARQMAVESSEHTLEATALVHEVYLRLVGSQAEQTWNSRGHFFAAASEAMRRILVEHARRKATHKRGGGYQRLAVDLDTLQHSEADEILAVHAALSALEKRNPTAARLVKYRYFAGFANREAADLLGISPRKATQIWDYARTWLLSEIEKDD
ncbi:MAG: ECF-type sigma factor [Planctomycetota bacterium]|nr:ECF-type sigma factor [Planctomycetota bacterium]